MNIANGCVPFGGLRFAVSARANTTKRRIEVAKNSLNTAEDKERLGEGKVKNNPAVLVGPVTVR